MPKKKTGQRKKADKQKLRQKEIRSKLMPLADLPCNATMEVKVASGFHFILVPFSFYFRADFTYIFIEKAYVDNKNVFLYHLIVR